MLGVAAWDVLTAAGGSLALTLIVSLLVGIGVLAVLFLGSAVVTLERFARVATRPRSVALFGLFWALVLGGASLHWADPEQLVEIGRFKAWALASLGAAVAVAVGVSLLAFVLRTVSSTRLSVVTLGVLGAAYGALVGASGRLSLALAPLCVAVVGAGLLAWRRRRGARLALGDAERLLWVLALALVPGVMLAVLLAEPQAAIALGGAWLISAAGALVLIGLLPLAAAGFNDTRRRAEWFIAVRYLVAKRRQTFISIITGICVVGIAAGVWLVVTVLAVMNGFENTWRDEIIGNKAHFTVQRGFGPFENYAEVLVAIDGVDGVVAATPYLDAEGMVRGGAGEIMGVRVRGIDVERAARVTDLEQDLITPGGLALLAAPPASEDPALPAGTPGIVVGSQLASKMGLQSGDPLTLISPFGGPQTPLGPAPRLKRFQVVGIFRSSFFQYDEIFTYVTLPAAQDFRRSGDVVDGIEVRTPDFYRSQAVGRAVQEALGVPFFTRDWKEFFPAFFQALKSERVMMFLLLSMIMVVAAFSIVSTLVMMIMEKESDIAILKTMGAEDETIERIFAIEGTLIGLVGTAIGVVAAISVTSRIEWVQRQVEWLTGVDTLPASVYQLSTLPAQLDLGQIAFAVGIAMVLALGATLLPSRQAARLDPVESLRYE
ncbi:MAG: lipoprotein-releasing ABC transporter permease subunit [Deltaproteobacteria bacterium]|nr:lipoprotein-releasing ABC transporter permease subunit [Deltaproteobacteria bacterium]